MYFAILQRWDGEKAESLFMEYPFDKKAECMRMLESVRRDAYQNKDPVTYRLIELDGEMQYEGKETVERRKREGVDQIILTGGKIHENVPLYIQKDKR